MASGVRLLTKREAALYCRCSISAFDAHVRPLLTERRIGRRVLFLESDLEAWAESLSSGGRTKLGPLPAPQKTPSGTRGSQLLAVLLSGPRAQETKLKLTQKPRDSSLRHGLESFVQPAEHGAEAERLHSKML